MRYAIFDIDGTVSDDRWRQRLLPQNGTCDADYAAYHEVAIKDKPMNVEVVEACQRADYKIVFLTSRPQKYREDTKAWLSEHFGTDWLMAMRPAANQLTSPTLKEYLIEESEVEWDDIAIAYDDREDVLHMYQQHDVTAVRLLYPYGHRGDVPDLLNKMAKTFEERQEKYGRSYERFGKIGIALWPDGLNVTTEEDFVRLGVVIQCISKLTRYVNTPEGHRDSCFDLSLYAAILTSVTDGEFDEHN